MDAKAYISITIDSNLSYIVSNNVNFAEFFPNKSVNRGKTSFKSHIFDINYDDLGKSIQELLISINIPDASDLNIKNLSYIQILVNNKISDNFKIYLDRELMGLIYKKGYGLDIHEI